ncbi:hypothetical protein CK203_002463 [Vitis vinifera]|uniref:Uncharacterized protein n=1 Tax=Vitis vinifera TaxID=29760 RepID=A0A438KI48_VITVI|nr:hypothetical protein CK203_002463 [Vitis vinifera]
MELFNKVISWVWVSSSISVWFILTTALVGGARVDSSLKYDALMAKGPVPPSAASSCTHIGGGNGGDNRPCPPSTRQDAVLMAKAPVPPSAASSCTHISGDNGGDHRPCLMAKAPVPPSAASSCTHIGGGKGGDNRPCPPSTHQDATLMGKAPVPPSAASSCTHIGGGNGGDHRPCPPSTRQDAVLMAKAPVPPSSASSSTHKGASDFTDVEIGVSRSAILQESGFELLRNLAPLFQQFVQNGGNGQQEMVRNRRNAATGRVT